MHGSLLHSCRAAALILVHALPIVGCHSSNDSSSSTTPDVPALSEAGVDNAQPPIAAPAIPPIADYCGETVTSGGEMGGESATRIGKAIDVYASCTSVYQGQRISFHLADHLGSTQAIRDAAVSITRLGIDNELVFTGTATMSRQQLPGDAWINCCNWPIGLDIEVPLDWRPGYYKARFDSPSGGSGFVDFVVKLRNPGSVSNIVLQVPFDTAQAYNNWGGKSLYGFSSSASTRAPRVSLSRPTLKAASEGHVRGVIEFVRWAESEGIALEYLTSADMHATPELLANYALFITVGHDEYWSREMRNALDMHLDRGAHAAILSGNTMWWRSRRLTDAYGRADHVLEVTKEPDTDTGRWYRYDPAARTIGATYLRGGLVSEGDPESYFTQSYRIYRPDHWALAGTGLEAGDTFGAVDRIFRFEVDGIDFRFDSRNLPVPTGADSAPASTRIIALASLPGWKSALRNLTDMAGIELQGEAGVWAAMTANTRANGSTVFNVGTTDYFRALDRCRTSANDPSPACRIIGNVIRYLANR